MTGVQTCALPISWQPVTEKFAASIKADAYSEDAPEAVKAARRLMQELKEERRAGAD